MSLPSGRMQVMDCTDIERLLSAEVSAGLQCRVVAEGQVLVSPPLTYADGDYPEILLVSLESGFVVASDFGSASGRLSSTGVSLATGNVRSAINSIARSYGMEFTTDNEIRTEITDERVGVSILDLAAAMLQIDALSVLLRRGLVCG